jgi:hypothetical protein
MDLLMLENDWIAGISLILNIDLPDFMILEKKRC